MNTVTHTKKELPRLRGGHLGVKIDGQWKLVFCRGRGMNGNRSTIEITEERGKALHADALEYFQEHFPGAEFSII